MITVTKIFSFAAAHHLPHHEGQCQKLHGHNYKLEVTVGGEINPKTGMVIDFGDLDCLVHKYVIKNLDHSNLNDFQENPTAEVLLDRIADVLINIENNPWKRKLIKLRLWETEKCYAEWTPDN